MTYCVTSEPSHREFNLEPLDTQVGGHVNVKTFNTKFVCKPFNQREHQFYKILPSELRNLVPHYAGTFSNETHSGPKYLVMENLVDGFQKPWT